MAGFGAAWIVASSVNVESSRFGGILLGLVDQYINDGQVFGKLIVRRDICRIVHLRSLRIYGWGESRSQDRLLQKGLIHKVCSEKHANLARPAAFFQVYETSPNTPLLFPLRETPDSPRRRAC